MMKRSLASLLLLAALLSCHKSGTGLQTYCNPIDLDYTYAVYDSDKNLSYRSGADPAVVAFKGGYFMFVTRSMGYWYSDNLRDWEFVTPSSYWYPQGSNAPAAHAYKDSVLYVAGDPSGDMSILYSEDPRSGKWEAVPAILHNLQDPDLFIDDDGEAYMFWGSSNVYPIRGQHLDRSRRFLPDGEIVALFNTDSTVRGWERFGENHSDPVIGAFIEGPWLTKHEGRYFMQYAAPGTEFNVYGDGVYTAEHPLGPYTYQTHNPFCYKGGGFMNGAGHGSTVEGPGGLYWHFGSMSLSAIVNWERRICMFPTFFDEDGIMYCDNEYGDYPHYAPSDPGRKGSFTGWMLLSYRKPVTASSFQDGAAPLAEGFSDANRPVTSQDFSPSNVTDENCKTYWLADDSDKKAWLLIDLQEPSAVHAVQINYFDHLSGLYGREKGLHQRYYLEASMDGEKWNVLADRSHSDADAPNAYIQLNRPATARFIRYRNVEVSAPHLAVCGLRVFGKAPGNAPETPAAFKAVRTADMKGARLSWDAVEGCQGYNVRWGIGPDKLYNSWLVYGENELTLRCLAADVPDYWFQIEAFSERGVSGPSPVTAAR